MSTEGTFTELVWLALSWALALACWEIDRAWEWPHAGHGVYRYALTGGFYFWSWWLRAVTNDDFRRMCGVAVITLAGLWRGFTWPAVALSALRR